MLKSMFFKRTNHYILPCGCWSAMKLKNWHITRVWRSSSYPFENVFLGLSGCTCLVWNSDNIKLHQLSKCCFWIHVAWSVSDIFNFCYRYRHQRMLRIKSQNRNLCSSKLSQPIFVGVLNIQPTVNSNFNLISWIKLPFVLMSIQQTVT